MVACGSPVVGSSFAALIRPDPTPWLLANISKQQRVQWLQLYGTHHAIHRPICL